mgnify:CR=1 FL=1
MSKKVTVDELASAIMKELEEFQNVTDEAVEKGVSETAKDAVKELQNAHPRGSGRYGSWDKKYNKGWKVMQTKTDKRYHKKATIHNATDYQLTHLLEKGHALRNGGRTRAFPHIAPVAEKCEDELVKNIKKRI